MQSEPIEYETAPGIHDPGRPPGPPGSRAVGAAAWLLIMGSLAIVAFANWEASRTTGRVRATEDFQLQLGARVVLGEVHLFGQSVATRINLRQQGVAQLSALATGAEQKLRLAILEGELQDAKAARATLDAAAPGLETAEGKSDLATLRTIYTAGPQAVPPAARAELVEHQGWFGNLTLSYGRPDSDPLRARVIHAADVAFIASAAVEGIAALSALVGLGLLIFAIIRLAEGRLHLCYGPRTTLTSAFLESFALYLAGYVGISLFAHYLVPHARYLGTVLSLSWIPLAMLWPLLRGITWAELKGGLGWYRGRGVLREAGAGVVGYVAGLPLMIVAIIVTILLTARAHANAAHPIAFGEMHGFWTIVGLYLLASVMAPLVEETMFRGALFTHLRQRHGWFVSAVVSSFIFAALHPQGWTAIPALGTIGFVLASIREWRGTFVASVTAHALNNGVLVTMLILAMR